MTNTPAALLLSTAFLGGASHAQTTIDIPRAQASVTLYGLLDVYGASLSGESVANAGQNGQATTQQELRGFNTGGWAASRLGIRGSKAFDNGLSALATFELGNLNLNSTAARDNGLTSTRKSFVGLSGGFGRVIAGRLQTPAFDWSNEYDASAGVFSALVNLQSMGGAGINSFDRVNNAATWTSPKWGGLSVQGMVGFPQQLHTSSDDGVAANHRQTIQQLHVNYAGGPFSVGVLVRNQANTKGVCAMPGALATPVRCSSAGSVSLQDGRKEWAVGGWYDFQVAKVFATHQVQDRNSLDVNTRITQAGVRVPVVGKGTVVASYASGATGKARAKASTIAFTYDLDGSTKLYVGWLQAKNTNPATPFGNISVGGSVSMTANKSVSGVAAGLNYSF